MFGSGCLCLISQPLQVFPIVTVRQASDESLEAIGIDETLFEGDLFEAGNLDDAVATFNRALDIVPSHAALNLNLVQVLMKQYQDASGDRELLKRCERCLEKLASLPEQHRQHRRLISLRKKLEGMMP